MNIMFRPLDNEALRHIASELNRVGHACVENFLKPDQLQELRNFVAEHAYLHQGQYFAYHGGSALAGTPLGALGGLPEFLALLAGIHLLGSGRNAFEQTIRTVLRCVQGRTGQSESNLFHYDASLLTALLPVEIPSQGDARGDLMLFPNSRRVRSSVLLNLIEKALLQNRFSRALLCLAIRRRWLKPHRLTLVPGNLYLFWGYRSLHANEPCDAANRRATAIFHYGDPHAGSLVTRLILRLNQRRARRASAAAAAQQNA